MSKIELTPIAVARTPYSSGWAPHQPPEREVEPGPFRIVVDEAYAEGLDRLERFSHLIVVSYLDRSAGEAPLRVAPPWAKGLEVGVFASRSPRRPSPLGLSVVRLLKVEGRELFTSPLDLLDETPVLDLKPYIGALDARGDANDGWIEDLDDHEHLLQHLRGAPHDHGHDHDHDHAHGRGHDHGHDHEHQHAHAHSHLHRHDHAHAHEHEGGAAQEHDHEHVHEHSHAHDHEGDHDHEHETE